MGSFDSQFKFSSFSFQLFFAYLGYVTVLVAHSHPVILVFCQLLIDRKKDHQPPQDGK